MTWVTVAEGSPGDMRITAAGAGKMIRHGAKFDIVIRTPWWQPVGPLFDSFAGEHLAKRLHLDTGGILLDAEGTGINEITLHMEANAVLITATVIAGMVALLVVVFTISGIDVQALVTDLVDAVIPFNEIESISKWIMGGIIVVALVIGFVVFTRPSVVAQAVGKVPSAGVTV